MINDARFGVMLFKVVADDPQVLGVRPEQQIERIADQRNSAYRRIEGDIRAKVGDSFYDTFMQAVAQ